MTLSASSRLLYWDARYGIRPHTGNEPHFSRNGEAWVAERSGLIRPRPVNTPLFGSDLMFDPQRISATERRSTLLVQPGRTNLCLRSAEFDNASWTKAGTNTITANATHAPDGTLTADRIEGGASSDVYQTITVTASTAYVFSFYVKDKASTSARYYIYNVTGAADIVGATSYLSQINTTGWTRVQVAFTTPVGCTSIRCFVSITSAGTILDAFIWGAQLEAGVTATSQIPTTSSAATRLTDSLYFDYPAVPQAAMYYSRFVEGGAISSATEVRIWSIGSATQSRLLIFSTAGVYRAYHDTGAGSVTSDLAAAAAVGQTVEIVVDVNTDGSVQIIQSIDGAAVSSGSASAALTFASSFSSPKLYLGGASNGLVGVNRFAELKAVKRADVVGATAQAKMDELRAFEFSGDDQLLAA